MRDHEGGVIVPADTETAEQAWTTKAGIESFVAREGVIGARAGGDHFASTWTQGRSLA